MARSLKEGYKLRLLQEKVRSADKQLLEEHRMTKLLLEAMNQEDLDKVTAIIQKLSKAKQYGVESLNAGIEQAEAEINKYTAGGPISKAWSTLKTKVGFDNPIVKVTTLADALERGFAQLPQILKNNGIDLASVDAENETLTTAITRQALSKQQKASAPTGLEKKEAGEPPTISSKDVEDTHKAETNPQTKAKIQSVVNQLRKAMSPAGIFGAFKKVPYVDTQALINDLMNTPLKNFSGLVKDINSGAKAAEVAPDLKAQATGAGEAETKGAQQGEPSKQTGQTNPGAPAKDVTASTATSPTGERPAAGPGQKPGGGAENKTSYEGKSIILTLTKEFGMDTKAAVRLMKRLKDKGVKFPTGSEAEDSGDRHRGSGGITDNLQRMGRITR